MLRTTLKSLWSHKLRLIATALAVVLGVAFMAGTLVLNSTIGSIFDDLFGSLGKNVDAVVRGPELFESQTGGGTLRSPLDDSVIDRVKAVDGVATAEGNIQSVDLTLLKADGEPLGGAGPPTVVGNWNVDEKMASYQVAEGRPPTKAGEAIIDRAAATKGGFQIGDMLTLITPKGRESLQLVGISRFGNADSAGGSTFLGTTLPEAQRLAGLPGKVNSVSVRADDGVTPEQLVKNIEAADVAKGADVVTGKQASDEQASDVKQGFGFFTTLLLIFAGIALFVGFFIITNTFSILVAQRTKELALLRAVGATRGQVLGSVLLEAAIIGVVSALIGLLVGIGLAAAAFAALRSFGLDLPGAGLVIEPTVVVQPIIVGLLVTSIAAVMPAVRATRVPPIAALRDVAVDTSGRSVVRAVIGVLLLVVGALLATPALKSDTPSSSIPSVGAGAALILVSILILGPVIARPLAQVFGWPLPWIKGVTGQLARENAIRSPRRTASTAAALIIGVTLVSFISIFATSATASINSALGSGFEGDYIIQPVNRFSFSGAPPSLASELANVEGVSSVASISFAESLIKRPGDQQEGGIVGAIDPTTAEKIFTFKMSQGALTDLGPGGMIVDRAIARDRDLKIGDAITLLSSTGGTATFDIKAISDDPALLGSWTIDRQDLTKLVPEPTDFITGVKLDPGVSVDSIRPQLKAVVAQYPNMQLLDREEYRNSIVSTITTLLNVIYALLAVSIVIAVVGILNTLLLSIHERTRELGLLRAMGMARGQMRSMVRWEAVIVALMGTALGILLGVGLSYLMVRALVSQGITQFSVNPSFIIVAVVGGTLLGIVAALWPAFKASRLNVLEAIATE